MLAGLIAKADKRIAGINSGRKPTLQPDSNAKYFAEVVVDLDTIVEPMIADPDVQNADVSKRYTHDTIRPISFYGAKKKVDLGFVGSCMVHKGDTVLATSTRLFKGRVVEDTAEKTGESLLASTPVVVLSAILGRTPTLEEYKDAVDGIDLTKFAPPIEKPAGAKSAHF